MTTSSAPETTGAQAEAEVLSRGSSDDYSEMYNKLADRAIGLHGSSESNQVFICVAGGPGSGKTTVSKSVCSLINEKWGDQVAVVLPMDGYHISQAKLKEIGSSGQTVDCKDSSWHGKTATFSDLMARRGSPWTFDAETLKDDFFQAKKKGEASLPTYSREKSDPVPGGVTLKKDHKIVLCEGLYLCSYDSPDWEPLRTLWDDAWYIAAPQDVVLERLIKRHLHTWTEKKTEQWGEGKKGAEAKARANELKNAIWVEEHSRHHADLIVEHY